MSKQNSEIAAVRVATMRVVLPASRVSAVSEADADTASDVVNGVPTVSPSNVSWSAGR